MRTSPVIILGSQNRNGISIANPDNFASNDCPSMLRKSAADIGPDCHSAHSGLTGYFLQL